METEALRREILRLVGEYAAQAFAPRPFVPGISPVPVSGRVFDGVEVQHLVDSALDFWLTTGRFAEQFEAAFAQALGVRHALLCNSGSSANLLALTALTSPQLGERALRPGDEVLTAAAGFPTTVNPILQNQLQPVLVDLDLPTYNVSAQRLAEAVSPRTRAIMLAHTLGNPFDLHAIRTLAQEHNLWLIEDSCDALGSTYAGQALGSFGDLATFSFYPAHHITMGEGGCVVTHQSRLKKIVESFRDWGRDCWCAPGQDNTCGKRFDWQLGQLPHGYDHKYTYSHIGYNLKLTDMQAAVGVAQLQKLPQFVAARQRNWQRLYDGLKPLEEFFILPQATPNSEPAWFGFLLTVRPGAPFERQRLIRHLDAARIGTRLLFGGNLARQPAYQGLGLRLAGALENSDLVMERSFWLGVYPGLTLEMLDYVIQVLHEWVRREVGESGL